jgi:hypothetical protein
MDIAHSLYMQSVLQGTVQKAGRDGTLETAAGNSDAARDIIDTAVRKQLHLLNNGAEIDIRRRFYKSFAQAAAAEPEVFYDSDAPSIYHDGICNNGERFDDRNNNGTWDSDGADSADHAGARDDIVYTVTVSYPHMFPVEKLIGGSGTVSLKAVTVLSNQPYGDQSEYSAPTEGHCS